MPWYPIGLPWTGLLCLQREVALVADFVDLVELGFEPVHVILFISEQLDQQVAAAVVFFLRVSGAEGRADLWKLRGAEAPLFHGTARIRECFRDL
jgi:hypothetical protein